MLRLGIFPAFDNKFTTNILGMCENWVDFTPHVGVLVPSEAVSISTMYKSSWKTDEKDTTHKNDATTLSWHIVSVNAFFWRSISKKQFKSLVLES